MATQPLAAEYPNPAAASSGKRGDYSYDDLLVVIATSGAPEHVRQLTLDALAVRGRWPKSQGPVTPIISVSITSLQDKATVWRSTIQRRIHRAKKDKYWREIRSMNSWLDCPKCGEKRDSAKCPKCPHKGNGFDPREFRRTFTYAIDVAKFESAQPCRQVREIRELRKRRDPRGVTEIRRDAAAQPARQTAEHQKVRTVVETEITQRATKAAQLMMEMCGLADIGAIPQIAISIAAEAKYRGIEIEDAAKLIAECATRDQQKGIALTRFYFRDLKWRSSDGRQQQNASQQRTQSNRQGAFGGILRHVLNDFPGEPVRPGAEPLAIAENADGGTVPDGGKRKHEPERGKGG